MLLSLAACTLALSAAELPSLTLLVGNKDENSMVFVDPATNQVLGKVATGNGPHEIAASTDGKLAFVANYGTGPAPGSTISVIDVVEPAGGAQGGPQPLAAPARPRSSPVASSTSPRRPIAWWAATIRPRTGSTG